MKGAALEASNAISAIVTRTPKTIYTNPIYKTVLLNGGDGNGEHPTQALLDAVTICHELGSSSSSLPSNLQVTFVGDLKNGRTVHSLSRLLSFFPNISINYVSPPELSMPSEIQDELTSIGIQQQHYSSLEANDFEVLKKSDVVYMTRVQKERFVDLTEYERLKHYYIFTKNHFDHCKSSMILLHPLPRVGEISEEVDSDPRAAYFRQVQFGMYTRMALLALAMGKTLDEIKHQV
jgi:aspartate carbamoyltransferase